MSTSALMQIRAIPPAPPAGWALWQLGFRPFYLGASLFAALSVGLWTAQMSGWITHPYLAGPVWHAHEMLFGFALAVIVGFLLTAGQSWSGRPTPTGPKLMALAFLWVAGRVLVLTPFGWAAAVVNTAFPFAAAIALAIPFIAAGNKRNYFFIGLLCALGVAAALMHLSQLGVLAFPQWAGIRAGLDVVLFIMVVMAGRVIPMFTNNGAPGAGAVRNDSVEKLALGSTLLLLGADVLQLSGLPLAVVTGVAALTHAVRFGLWRPWKTLHVPIVWVLHAAYAWIPLHLLLRALAESGVVAGNLATHALTVGAIGTLTIGMMTRTARGHTGRPLQADAWDTACYLLIVAAALVRVALPLVVPSVYMLSVALSGLLWSTGFGLYAIRYWPVLTRPRLDGKPG